jgi:hypothetical protein
MLTIGTISRRTFVSTGASLLAAVASSSMLPRVYAAKQDAFNDPTQEPGPLPQPPHFEASTVATTKEGGHHTKGEMGECIQICQDCHATCTQTTGHCMKLGGRHAAPDHIRLLVDCAQICAISADYMLRESSLHDKMCGLCSEACRQCAESCDQLAGADKMVKRCAEMCRRCAGSCERLASKVTA